MKTVFQSRRFANHPTTARLDGMTFSALPRWAAITNLTQVLPVSRNREMETGAKLSDCNTYRYLLWRIWNPEKWKMVFIMLNPSTAAHTNDDPTIRRCMRFAASNNYGGIIVANLFAYRCTNPAELPGKGMAIGPHNDDLLRSIAEQSGEGTDIVFAWGTKGAIEGRDKQVISLFPNAFCLEKTKDGHPKHPLYIRADAKLIRFQSDELALSVETAH